MGSRVKATKSLLLYDSVREKNWKNAPVPHDLYVSSSLTSVVILDRRYRSGKEF